MSVDDQEIEVDLGRYPFGVIPGDAGEGEWWLAEPEPVEIALPNDWWAGVLEGFRLGAELARLGPAAGLGTSREFLSEAEAIASAESTAPRRRATRARPSVPGRVTR